MEEVLTHSSPHCDVFTQVAGGREVSDVTSSSTILGVSGSRRGFTVVVLVDKNRTLSLVFPEKSLGEIGGFFLRFPLR